MSEKSAMTRQERTQQNICLILETAISLFNERGYEETTVADISKATGLSNGSIYHLFPSKQDILKQIYHKYINISIGLLENLEEKVKDPYPVLLKFMLDVQALWMHTGPMMLDNKFRWDTERSKDGCSTIQREELTVFLKAAQTAGILQGENQIEDAVEFLFTLQRGLLYGWAIRDDFDIMVYSKKFWEPVLKAFLAGDIVIAPQNAGKMKKR